MDSALSDAVESPLRKSTRKKVQTTHYGHESPSFTSPQSSISKESQELDSSEVHIPKDVNLESDESSDDDIPLSHYSPEKGKKRGAKASNAPKQPSSKKRKTAASSAGKTKGRRSSDNFPEKGSMFDIIRGGRVALQAVIDDWIEGYNNERVSAMVDLIQVIIQCCGCKGIVSEDMLDEDENVNAIRKLTEEFDEDSHEYPLIMSGQEYKRFKNNFCEFIDLLIEQCQHDIVYDDYMMDKLSSWLISLSDSQVRAFRHTSTLAGMKLVAAVIQICLKVNVELDNTQRQLDSEKRKSASKRGVQKMEMLQNKKDQLRDNIHQLEEYMNFIFQGTFLHRYRDVRPEIRSLCISEIGSWMKEHSSYFLSHKYLKYVVWTLHDKDGDVRFHALQSLLKLYEVEEFLPQLEPLTSRFKGRIVAMTLDVEHTVSVVAIKLVSLLFHYNELDEEDCQQVEQLVFCSHRLVAHEAGAFLNERLLAEAEKGSPSKKKASKKSEFQRKAEYFKKLVDFFVNSRIHNHASYLVDSLWQHCDLLKEWEVMTTMLLDDKASEDLSDDEETALIEIMTCCCRQAATGQGPPGRFLKRLLSTKEKKTIVNDKQEMSGHFMVQLPVLLGKYGTDLPKAENLVCIAQYFDLEEYSQRRLGEHFEDLLNQLDDLVQKGPETSLLEECAKTYRVLTNNELTLKSKAEVARNKLIDSIVELFKEGHKYFNPNEEGEQDEDGNSDAYALEVNLKRITAFYRYHDLGAWDLYDVLNDVAVKGSDELRCNALVSIEMYLIWSFNAMTENPPSKRQMNTLKMRLQSYMQMCAEIIEQELGEVRKRAFLCVADVIVVFAKQLNNKYPSLSSLVYSPNFVFQETCATFATTYAFSNLNAREEEDEDEDDNTESEVEELNSKRVVLVALCKLLSYGIFDMRLATVPFSHLITAYGNFGDLIKQTMAKCKENNVNYYTKTLALTLFQEYERLPVGENGLVDKTSQEYIALKELAKRFALSYGIELTKEAIRKAMINLHREAILHSFKRDKHNEEEEEENEMVSDSRMKFPFIGFLDVIIECSSRLIPQDKKAVLGILKKEMEERKLDEKAARSDPRLQPLASFYKAMFEGSQPTSGKGTKLRPAPTKAKRKLDIDYSRGAKSSVKTPAKRKSSTKGKTKPQEKDKEQEEQPSSDEASPIPDEQQEEDESRSSQPTKRKREDVPNEEYVEEEENSEDEFQESSGVKASSQASWVASQSKTKRSANHSKISYGRKAKNSSRLGAASPIEEAEEEFSEDERETSPVESPKLETPPPKRTKKNIPENIFEEPSPNESPTDEDLPTGFSV